MYFDREEIELPAGVVQGNHIDIEWLKQAKPEEQKEALFQWFTNQYEDPVESLPYDSREGGYIPIHGNLVDPFDEFGEFGDIVSDEIINDVAQELVDIAGDAWSPTQVIDDFYELEQTVFNEFEARVQRSISLLDNGENFLIKASIFSLLITAFETYLWEKTKENITKDKLNLESNLIKNMPEFQSKATLAEIYSEKVNIKERLIEILNNETVWHNIKIINLVFKKGFMLDSLPDFSNIQKALKIRHDIVHRFGMNQDGFEMPLTKENILDLKNDLLIFAQELEQKINDKLSSL